MLVSSFKNPNHVFERAASSFGFGYHALPFLKVHRLSNLQQQLDQVHAKSEMHFRLGSEASKRSNQCPVFLPLAFRHFTISAAGGHSDAQYALAKMLLKYPGPPSNRDRAGQLLATAAQTGHARAAYWWSLCLRAGISVPKNDRKAFRWLRLSAEGGCQEGMFALGRILMKSSGRGDHKGAYAWLRKAAQGGHEESMRLAQEILRKRHGRAPEDLVQGF
jgi:TPR repeat protein